MKSIKLLLILIVFSIFLYGCAAVLVGGLLMKSSTSEKQKTKFLIELQKTNIEREKNGLKPLDRCIEIYHFDPGWAEELDDCAFKVDSLKKAGAKYKKVDW